MNGGTIPYDQQWLLELAPPDPEKLDALLGADGSWKKGEVELPDGRARNSRELLRSGTVLKNRFVTGHQLSSQLMRRLGLCPCCAGQSVRQLL